MVSLSHDIVCAAKLFLRQEVEVTSSNLNELESEAYQDSHSDGFIDLAIGLSLASIGIIWLWIESLPGLAGVLSVGFAWTLVYLRRRILEPRLGYVRWREPRLRWERRQLLVFTGLVMAAFLLGNGVMFALREGDTISEQGIVPALPAFVLGFGAFAVAAKVGFRRLWGYGIFLIGAAVITLLADANPGGSLLASGALICGVGGVLLLRFLHNHPVRDLG
jgi:hypothetical protein